MLHNNILCAFSSKRQIQEAQRQQQKKKKQKKFDRQKQIDEAHEQDKHKWQSFASKVC